MGCYTHLAEEERYQIYTLLKPVTDPSRSPPSSDVAPRPSVGSCDATAAAAVTALNKPMKWLGIDAVPRVAAHVSPTANGKPSLP